MREMVGRVPLLDEILVIDSASTDRTREIAEAEGARVVQHPDVLARYGSFTGKGEALWKSVYETTGDIIVWADTDVKNWHPRMVYGTLGPLLHEPRLQYVKGYYQRPIVEGGVLKEGGGGRVTELVARPLINLFFPELSGMIQPLAGEYAGRRSLLESIPFFTGYAVEIGHLIDAAERVGIEGLGQVDLERRVHRNQELEGLSRMSFVILQAVMKRLEERRKARLFAEMGSTMKLPRSGHGRLSLEVIELADQERPPMIRIPEYLERRAPRVTPGPVPAVRCVKAGAWPHGRSAHRRSRPIPRADSAAIRVLADARLIPAPAAARPGRAGFDQGHAHQRRGGAGARRRLAARPARRRRPAGAARGRRRGHAGGDRGGGRLGRRAPSGPAGAVIRAPWLVSPTGPRPGRRDGGGVEAVARRARERDATAPRPPAPATCCVPRWTPASARSCWASAAAPRPTAAGGCSGPGRAGDGRPGARGPRRPGPAARERPRPGRLRRDEPAPRAVGRGRRLRPAEGRVAGRRRGPSTRASPASRMRWRPRPAAASATPRRRRGGRPRLRAPVPRRPVRVPGSWSPASTS